MDKIKIVLLQGLVGNNVVHEKGDVVDWPRAEAERFIKRGIAKAYTEANQPARK